VRFWSVRSLAVGIVSGAIIVAAAAAQTNLPSSSSNGVSGRVLTGEEIRRALVGNTLLARDDNGPFWMYFPGADTVWGQSSSGDVDVGHWWVQQEKYCRQWRRWYGGATQCWTLADAGDDQIIWIDGQHTVQGATLIQPGNTIGLTTKLASVAPAAETIPIAVTGTIGPERRFADRDPGRSSAQNDSGGNSSGGSSSGNGSSGGSSGSSSGGGSDGGSSGASSSGGSSGGDDGGSGGHGSGKGKGKGEGHGKSK